MLELRLACALVLAVGLLQVSRAQESDDKPQAPAPKTVPSSTSLSRYSPGPPSKKSDREAETVDDISALATSVAGHISATGCQPKSCTVLVTDFTFRDGNTSAYGLQLAETLSHELTNREYKLRVIDRKLLQTFQSKERVPTQSEHRTIIEWISGELDARFIVFGTTEKPDDGVVKLSSQLIDTNTKEWKVYSAIVNLEAPRSAKDLDLVDPLPPLPPITTSSSGEKVERMGVDGTTIPNCFYIPNPPYSEGARKLKLSGSVIAEAVVNSQGKLESMRIVRGLPGGLNDTTIASMRTWQCHPALKDGKPVPVLVPFSVTFRLY